MSEESKAAEAKLDDATSESPTAESEGARKRVKRTYPFGTFEDAMELALAIQEHASGQKVRRLTIFDKMNKAPESGPSRQMISLSSRYGLTVGSQKSEYFELSDQGRIAS